MASSGGSLVKLGAGTLTLTRIVDGLAVRDGTMTVAADGLLQSGVNGTNNLAVGYVTSGIVNVAGGQFSTNQATLGWDAFGAIAVTSGTYTSQGTTSIGFNGFGDFRISGGSATASSFIVAENIGSTGSMTISGGTMSGGLRIGASGSGGLSMTSGLVSATSLTVGKSGTGTLSMSGGTITSSAALGIGASSGTGAVSVSGGSPVVGGNLLVGGLNSVINGYSSLRISGSGGAGGLVSVSGTLATVAFGGSIALTFGGTISIGSGGAGGVLASALTNNGTLIFNRADASTCGVQISETGEMIKRGSGMLSLPGTNTYSGLTTIDSGTLRIGSGRTSGVLPGDVVNNASLVFDRSNNLTYGGRISGSDSVRKNGVGRLVLSGSSPYSGLTTVGGGTLEVNGILAGTSLIQLLAGATLSGTGTIAGAATISGTHSPGATSPGTLAFN